MEQNIFTVCLHTNVLFFRAADGHFRSYEIDFVCNRSIAKGKPAFSGVDGLRTRFEFQTSLACEPQSVDCLVAGNYLCCCLLILL